MKKLLTLTLALLAATGSSAFAASGSWNASTTDGNWETTGTNWSNGAGLFPGAITGTTSTDIATFLSSSTTSIAINGSPLNVKGITFGATSTALSAFTIGTTSGNALLLTSNGTITYLAGTTSTGTDETINAPITIEGNYTFNNSSADSTNTLNFGGAISSGGAGTITLALTGTNTGANTVSGAISNGSATALKVTQSGTGMWVLSGNNSYTGVTTVSAGTLVLSGDNSLASGGVTVAGGATLDINSATALGSGTFLISSVTAPAPTPIIDNTSGQAVTVTTTGAETWNSFTFTGTNNLTFNGGAITLGNATTITVTSGILTVDAAISGGSKPLTKSGNGILVLAGTNTYTGSNGTNGTTISAGSLVVGGNVTASGAGPLSTGAVFLGDTNTAANNSSAALLTGGAFTIDRTISINANTTAGVLSVGGYTDNNSAFEGQLQNSNSFSVTQVATSGTNALTLSGGVRAFGSTGGYTINFANVGAVDVTGTIIDSTNGATNSVSQTGSGVTTFTAKNTYTGGTTISNGTVYANNNTTGQSSLGTGTVTVNGGTLSGLGIIAPTGLNNVVIGNGGILAAGGVQTMGGAANGNLTINGTGYTGSGAALALNAGAKLTFALGSGGTSSAVNILGTVAVTFGGNVVTINDLVGTNLTSGGDYVLFEGTTNTFYSGLDLGGQLGSKGTIITGGLTLLGPGGNTFADEYGASVLFLTTSGDIDIEVDPEVVPEPSTWAMMLGGLSLLLIYQRKRRS